MEPVMSSLYSFHYTEQDGMTKLEYSLLEQQNSGLAVVFSLDSDLGFEPTFIAL